jgi:4-aminobutyrate aminotransferase-like enzyme
MYTIFSRFSFVKVVSFFFALQRDVVVLDHAYHGHTAALIDISPYKWAQATDGVQRRPATTHVVSCPDTYRGQFRLASRKSHSGEIPSLPADGVSSLSSATIARSPSHVIDEALAFDSEGKSVPPVSSNSNNNNTSNSIQICSTEEEAGVLYAQEVEDVVGRTGGVAAFIAESLVGCGGQIDLPKGYLKRCYDAVRATGGQ